jgi:hypothetical protein
MTVLSSLRLRLDALVGLIPGRQDLKSALVPIHVPGPASGWPLVITMRSSEVSVITRFG